MNIIADENIPFAREAFGQFGDVRVMSGRMMSAGTVADADALIVRSITRIDRQLLTGSRIRFVGTATVGNDHVDLPWLSASGIAFADAAASGTRSVAEYVMSALFTLRRKNLTTIAGDSIGIVGVGRIGSRLAYCAHALGMHVTLCDPPRAIRDPEFVSADMAAVLDCHIISLHVPLTRDGDHPTHHLIDGDTLRSLRNDAILINTSRGAVVDCGALSDAFGWRAPSATVLDVWEGEPDVPLALIDRCTLATPHIAGYALDAKARGTELIADALATHCGTTNKWHAAEALPEVAMDIDLTTFADPFDAIRFAIQHAYMIIADDAALRSLLTLDESDRRTGFDILRRDYPVRREFPAFRVRCASDSLEATLSSLGFSIIS